MSEDWLEQLKWDERGLVAVVVQDAGSGEVLMQAWADREAVRRTCAEGRAWFYSRSRRSLWLKGGTSGNILDVAEVACDCDGDALLYRVRPRGPACHTGERTCFHRTTWRRADATPAEALAARARPAEPPRAGAVSAGEPTAVAAGETGAEETRAGGILDALYALVLERKAAPPPGSYVTRLLESGRGRILQKVGEEAVEVVIAGMGEDRERLVSELADLLFHVTVLLGDRGVPWSEVFAELRRRRK